MGDATGPGSGSNRVSFRLDGQQVEPVDGARSLVDVIRRVAGSRALRTGCAAGDCGLCAVLLDGRRATSCDRTAGTVAGASVETPRADTTAWRRTWEPFLDLDAGQCGYCVPGFVAATAALVGAPSVRTIDDLRSALDGHLCRCGAYARLLQAAARAVGIPLVPAVATDGSSRTVEPSDDISACELVTVRDDLLDGHTAPPPELADAPDVADWLRFHPDGTVELLSGRSDIGQSVHTALRRIVASTLGIGTQHVRVTPPSTEVSPDEGFTSGSRSMQQSGLAAALAAATARQLLGQRAEVRTGIAANRWTLREDGVLVAEATQLPLADLVTETPLRGRIRTDLPLDWRPAAAGSASGHAELRAKLTARADYVQDLQPAGLLHARVVVPPHPEARLRSAEPALVRAWAGVVDVVADGSLLLLVAEDEATAREALERLASTAAWSGPGFAPARADHRLLQGRPTTTWVEREDPGTAPALPELQRFRASYDKPYQAHAPIAPSAAVARVEGGRLQVWSQTQGVYPLRAELAAIMGRHRDEVIVEQVPGPGCYGHNAADDAAAFAALAAEAVPGRPVRFQFEPDQEFLVEPYGSAMSARLEAWVQPDGTIVRWQHDALTDTHGARPRGQGDRLLASWLRADDVGRPDLGASGGGARNIEPIYDVGLVQAHAAHAHGPLRTSSLRSLGAVMHVFAIESLLDEIARAHGLDPAELRRRHLHDTRAQRVLDEALQADEARWAADAAANTADVGRGIALARYAGNKAYAAVVARVRVDLEGSRIIPVRLTVAADAGAAVDPDGLRQQLEGGVVHGLSRTFGEEVRVGREGVSTTDWTSYRVARATDVPPLHVVLVDRPGCRPLGAGEASTPPVAPAIANAIADATGIRLRSLPFTPEHVRAQLLDANEAAEG